jgi:hypothetical protein
MLWRMTILGFSQFRVLLTELAGQWHPAPQHVDARRNFSVRVPPPRGKLVSIAGRYEYRRQFMDLQTSNRKALDRCRSRVFARPQTVEAACLKCRRPQTVTSPSSAVPGQHPPALSAVVGRSEPCVTAQALATDSCGVASITKLLSSAVRFPRLAEHRLCRDALSSSLHHLGPRWHDPRRQRSS